MITILYCSELNLFRLRDIISGREFIRTEEQLKKITPQWVIDKAKANPDEEDIAGI